METRQFAILLSNLYRKAYKIVHLTALEPFLHNIVWDIVSSRSLYYGINQVNNSINNSYLLICNGIYKQSFNFDPNYLILIEVNL